MRIENLGRAEAFVTKDGSEIRELAGVPTGNAENQSLAEATVPPGGETEEHHHRVSEEIYLFTHGSGRLRLGDEESEVTVGDTVVIPPGTRHKLWNTGAGAAEAALLLLTAVLARGHGSGLSGERGDCETRLGGVGRGRPRRRARAVRSSSRVAYDAAFRAGRRTRSYHGHEGIRRFFEELAFELGPL